MYKRELAEFRRAQEIAGKYPPQAVAPGGSKYGTQSFITNLRLAELEEQERGS